uniref:LIM homeobox 2 n=1 Tax=Oryctolagus cuniculus TaxID=9986 RepID=A0A5F9CM10_RABIT
MLFHSLSGPEVHGVIDEMDRRAKSEAPAISSAIDRGDTETTMPSISSDRAALCAGCGGKISDRYYLLAVDKQWHMRCLKCCECKLNLESELTCFSKDGSIYCKEDYYRRFSVQRCARCHLGISASEMVMRARDLVYHLNCFTCTTCNKMLTTGDHFGMKDSLVYCRLHFEALLQGEYPAHFNHADVAAAAAAAAAAKSAGLGAAGANPLGLPYYNGVGTVQKGRPRKRKSPGPGADLAAYNAGLVSECPGQVQAQPLTAGKHGRGQVHGRGAAAREPARKRLLVLLFFHQQAYVNSSPARLPTPPYLIPAAPGPGIPACPGTGPRGGRPGMERGWGAGCAPDDAGVQGPVPHLRPRGGRTEGRAAWA